MGAGHIHIHLSYDQSRHLCSGFCYVHAYSQAQVTVLVRQRGLDQGHVHRYQFRSEEIWDTGEEDGCVVSCAPVDGISGAVSYKEGVEPEVLLELFIGVGSNAQSPDMNQLGVEERLGIVLDIVDERLNKILRLAATGSYEYPISRVDMAEYGLLRHELLRIDLLELFQERIVFHSIFPLRYRSAFLLNLFRCDLIIISLTL